MSVSNRILRAIRRERVDATPIWFMRQAGRSLPKYRDLRADIGMFDVLRDPEAAARITRMPLEYYPVDACVLYNDLSTPFFGAGFEVEMRAGVGPVVSRPILEAADVDRLQPFDPRVTMDYILEQIRLLTRDIEVPVLGFVGAPFTLCSYLIGETRGRNLEQIKTFMRRQPEAWDRLAGFWADHLADFAVAQHQVGAAAIQVFDSWAGTLSPQDYERYLLPHMRTMFERLEAAGIPSINFFTGNPRLLPLVAGSGGDVVSVDWRIPIDEAWSIIGDDRALQGNLDPTTLLAGREVALEGARDVLDRVGGRPGHIFNCGHGLLPDTDPDVLRAVVDFVHDYTA
ncbi:MAG TPA: uroporphyrinogen decarboxylase [Longimicrobiaceae bacterium]|nr:uroporphyrinogen decarboxylase [Longimicrobiaceae bacterium]